MNRKKRIIAKAIFAVLTAVMLFACKPEGEKVTGVVLDHRELKADIGQTVTLTATVLPAEAANPKVSWEAVPEGFVELTADGALCTVKAVKAGKAAVLVTTEDGGFTAICTVTVLPVPAESVTLDRETVSLVLGNPAADTATLTATVFPENAENKTVSWSADKTDYIELTDNGNGSCTVKALKVGETVVTATTADGGFTATCTVTVSLIAAESVELNRNKLNLIVGDPESDTATLTATVYPENAENKTVSWSADKTDYIELTDNGNGSCTVKALKAGSVTVTATVEDSGHTATCTVTVSSVSAESVELDREELNLIVGDPESETATLTATVFPENAENKTVSWNAVPKGVVELTVDGAVCTVKALKEGEAVVMVTAADGGFMATCTVTVPPVLPESIELDRDELNLIWGDPAADTATLTATVFPENAPNKAVSWSVEPENIVGLTVGEDSRCTIRALNVGHAVVTVTAEDGGETASCRVTVSPTYAESIALNREKVDLLLSREGGETATLTATVSPENTTNKTVIWSAEPAYAVKLTDNGNGSCTVEALKVGEVTVTATAADGSGHTATCTVTVSPVTAESVTLDREKVDLILSSEGSETATLTATVFPENALNKTIFLSAEPSDAVKLTVNGNGSFTVEALKVGEIVVTATAQDGGHTANCTVTVAPVAAESVSLKQKKLNLLLSSEGGKTATLTATVFPENTLNKTVSWSAEPADAVKLTDNGNGSCTVEALKVGEVTVTATAADGSGHTATCTVTVSPVAAKSVSLEQKKLNLLLSSEGGETATLTATVFPENALNKTVSWSAEPANAVKLTDNGNGSCTVEALKVGETVVTATAEDGGHTATCTVTVSPVLPESIELDRDELKLVYGDSTAGTATLTATVFPENALDKTVRWTVAPEGVVALHDNGDGSCTVTALGGESATVTVSLVDSAATAACRISVDYPYLTNTAFIKAVDRATTSPANVGWIKESDGTVKLTPENLQKIRAVTELVLSRFSLSDLGGIEYFTGLTYLKCYGNNLTTLDVSGCTALTELTCYEYNLTTLDVSGCTELTKLYINYSNLTTLDVSGCTALTSLDCRSNNLTTLDVSGCTALTELNCSENNLTTLDVTKNTALAELDCGANNLTTLDVTKNTALTYLNCNNNNLTTLDVTKNTALTYLNCNSNNLTTLDVTKNTALTELYCSSNNLTTLDVTKNTALTDLDCRNNKLTTLDVTNNTALTGLFCGYNNLTTLDIRPLSRLTRFRFVCTPQRENPDGSIRQLTLKLTQAQKSKFELNESSDLKLEVYD